MSVSQFRQFLRPNFSFKEGVSSRGCKGVGATYLAYGFNFLEVATKHSGLVLSGTIQRGREWVEDRFGSMTRPRVETSIPSHRPFHDVDRGTSMTVKLVGPGIRPRDLGWVGASTAEQWLSILRTATPVGGIYLSGDSAPPVRINIAFTDSTGETSTKRLDFPMYLYPHLVMTSTADLREFLALQRRRASKGEDVSKIPIRFTRLNGLWGEWTGEQILDKNSHCPIQPRLDDDEQRLVRELGIKLYIFLAFSTDLWDAYNDKKLSIRKGHRLLRGGLQLATRHMPQGALLTIPMTNNIGFQNLAHVIVHFANAEPDLGRKGFQPDVVRIAEKLSVSAVTAFRRHSVLLRKPGGARFFGDELQISNWIKMQEQHERDHALIIKGEGLFMPSEELPIRSEPIVEQDVVALFNQMLSAGVIRGVQLIASSTWNQYDGLFRVRMEPPFEKFIYGPSNPLGIDIEFFSGHAEKVIESPVRVLEYKYSLDGLIEELQQQVKVSNDIGLAVAWEMGKKWRQIFDVTSYLDGEHLHVRQIHGTTHSCTHSESGQPAFECIILKDLIGYLLQRDTEVARQRRLYLEYDDEEEYAAIEADD